MVFLSMPSRTWHLRNTVDRESDTNLDFHRDLEEGRGVVERFKLKNGVGDLHW